MSSVTVSEVDASLSNRVNIRRGHCTFGDTTTIEGEVVPAQIVSDDQYNIWLIGLSRFGRTSLPINFLVRTCGCPLFRHIRDSNEKKLNPENVAGHDNAKDSKQYNG